MSRQTTNNPPPPGTRANGREPWYVYVPVAGMLVESWRKHPVAGVCALLILLLMGWSLWANWEDTFGGYLADRQAAAEQAARDAAVEASFTQVRGEVGRAVETLDALLVVLSPEQIRQLRQSGEPRLQLFYYDDQNSRLAFDAAAPEFRPGQYLHVEFDRPAAPGATTPHEYLLAIKSTGEMQLYPAALVSEEYNGDWEISEPVDSETLLVIAADHELSDAEQEQLLADLADLPAEGLAIRRNKYYEWNNGEVVQQARLHETRDLKRNPEAPAGWVDAISRKLAENKLAFHGYTYPVAESP